MSEVTHSSVMWKGTAASVALLIVFLAAWQWGPGLLRIPPFIIPRFNRPLPFAVAAVPHPLRVS